MMLFEHCYHICLTNLDSAVVLTSLIMGRTLDLRLRDGFVISVFIVVGRYWFIHCWVKFCDICWWLTDVVYSNLVQVSFAIRSHWTCLAGHSTEAMKLRNRAVLLWWCIHSVAAFKASINLQSAFLNLGVTSAPFHWYRALTLR